MSPLQLDAPDFSRRYLNLADPRIGAEAVSASDDFFAPKERMLNPEPAIFVRGKYDEHGKSAIDVLADPARRTEA
ncbi:MAG TPA: hypothetical protein VNY04_07785 [Chthoniobacterales bacterium]|nr:hypothetical protein [Chthoniobacterales bacterium]